MYGYFGWKQNATASAEAAGKVRGALEMQAGALSTALRDAKAKRDDDATAPTPASAADPFCRIVFFTPPPQLFNILLIFFQSFYYLFQS